MGNEKKIEIPFGAFDSELEEVAYTIPHGYYAVIDGDKVVIKKGEEPVSNNLEAEFVLYLKHKFNIPQEGNTLKTDRWSPSPYDLLDIAKHFAQWQKKQEVKEVDLEKEVHNAANQYDINNNGNIYWEDIVGFAKHFFELGLKSKGE